MAPLHRGFRGRTRLLFTGLALVTLLLFTGLLHTLVVKRLQRTAETEQLALLDKVDQALRQAARARLQVLGTLGDAATLWSTGLDSREAQDLVDRLQRSSRHPGWLGIVDLQGRIRTATGGRLLGHRLSDESWLGNGLRSGRLEPIDDPLLRSVGAVGGQHALAFVVPIRRGSEVLGLLVEVRGWDWADAALESVLAGSASRQGLSVMLGDGLGRPLYRHTEVSGNPGRVAGPLLVERSRWSGPDEDLDWLLVLEQPRREVHADADQLGGTVLLAGLLFGLVLVGGIWWSSARLARPVERIAAAAQRIAEGHLDTAIPQFDRGSAEFRAMSRAIATMSERLIEAKRVLEEEVRARTAELEDANARLAHLADTDQLTGLLNRRGLEPRLAHTLALARRQQSPVSVMALDIDHFKAVNDQHGHATGDAVLRELGRWLGQRFRGTDLCARTGGEEFVLVLIDSPGSSAEALAWHIVREIAQLPMPGVGRITVSIGLAESGRTAGDGTELLLAADAALYAAKRAGRNRVVGAVGPASPA